MKIRVAGSTLLPWIAVVLQLLLIQSCSCKSLTWQVNSGKSGECVGIWNPFLNHLKNNGVEILSQPRKEMNHCLAEWGSHGTCCEPHQVVKYIGVYDKDKEKMFEALEKTLESSIDKMKKFYDHMSKSQGTSQTVLGEIRYAIDSFEKFAHHVRYKERKCYASIRTIVGAAVCSACSTRSKVFFQGRRALISEQDCRSTIDDCGEGWRYMQRIRNVAHKFVQKLKKLPAEASIFFTPDVDSESDSWSNNLNLEESLNRCTQPKSRYWCPFEVASTICENMINIFEPSYLSKFIHKKGRKLGGITIPLEDSSGTSEIQVQQGPSSGSTPIKTTSNQMP